MTAIASRSLSHGQQGGPSRVGVLGPLELRRADGRTLTLRSPRQRALLAVLTVRAARSVGVDELV